MRKYVASIASLFIIVGLIGSTSTVSAANAATCGDGYSRVTANTLREPNGTHKAGPGRQKLYVKKVQAGWRWCLITDRVGAAEGVPGYTFAGLQRINSSTFEAKDGDNYSRYAGAVYLTTSKKAIAYKSEMHFKGKTYVHVGNLSN